MASGFNLGLRHVPRWLCITTALALVAPAALTPLTAQVAAGIAKPARLEVTTASAEARTAFTSGMEDLSNGFFNRGIVKLKKAVDTDASFGLARVIHGITAAGLTTAQRNEEIAKGITDATKASTGELLFAQAYVENFRQNTVGARAILLSAGTILPDEPMIAFQRATWLSNLTGGVQTDAIPALKQVIERFPDFAASYNTLAYAQWQAGARADAMTTATTYMAKAPQQPKSHDTFAELLQWDGDYAGAVAHYTKAIEIDPTFLGGAYGLSEVYVLQGKGDLARQTLTAALANTTLPAQRVTIFNRIANSFVLEGNIKAAMTTLATVIEEAQKGELPGGVVGGHVALMNLEAAFGNPKTSAKSIGEHIALVNAVPPPPPGAPPLIPANRFSNTGTVYAIAGHSAQARVYLDSLTQQAKTTPTPQATAQVHALTGWVLFSEGKFAEAVTELRQGNQQNATVRAGIALSQFKLGNVVEARSIRDELVNDRNLNLANGPNITARRIVKLRII